MASLMDNIHLQGIDFIQYLQDKWKDQSEFMLFLSHLGDPRNAFLVYFPLVYFFHRSVGIRVVWVAAVSEWLNAVFKFILHGERPYWWVEESSLYNSTTRPHLQQYRLSCETGPGSPSGHAMVTSSVLFILISDFLFYRKIQSVSARFICWAVFGVAMIAVNLSRCYIATHFPHQVLAGVIVGVVIAQIFNSFSTVNLTLQMHAVAAVGFLSSTILTYYVIESMGLEALWSIAKAKKWCARPEWVYLDTTLFYSVVRDASSLLGLSIAHFALPNVDSSSHSLPNRIVHASLSLILARLADSYKLPTHPHLLFYVTACTRLVLLFIVMINIIPRINFFANNDKDKKTRKTS